MLKQRVITALVIGVALLYLLLFASVNAVAITFWLISTIAAYEWAKLAEVESIAFRTAYTGFVAAVVAGCMWWPALADVGVVIAVLSGLIWLGIMAFLVYYQMSGGKTKVPNGLKLLMGAVVLGSTGVSLLGIRQIPDQGQVLLIALFVLVSAADSGAYFSGKALGKRKLAPVLSPGKSIEGVIGGAVFSGLLAALLGWYLDWSVNALILFVALWIPMALISVAGDLFESLLKRQAGVKDSGKILPGHGGILDRIDSHIATAPFFYLTVLWITQ